MNNGNSQEDIKHTQSRIFPLGVKMQKESKFMQKSKEYLRSKKAVSMKHIFGGTDKINININQSININANPNAKFQEQDNTQDEKGIRYIKRKKVFHHDIILI